MRLLLFTGAVFLFGAHRLPAPIVEQEDKPTATSAPEKSEAPKQKHHSTKSTSAEQSPAQTETKMKPTPAPAPVSQGPARFAGMWSGKINPGLLGHVPTSVTVDPTATSVELNHDSGGANKRVTMNGNSISWKSGVAGEVTWTLTPNSDGQTAEVAMNDTTTFRRGQAPSTPTPKPERRAL